MDGPPGSPDMPQLMDADDLSRRGPSPAATQSAIVDSTTRPDPQPIPVWTSTSPTVAPVRSPPRTSSSPPPLIAVPVENAAPPGALYSYAPQPPYHSSSTTSAPFSWYHPPSISSQPGENSVPGRHPYVHRLQVVPVSGQPSPHPAAAGSVLTGPYLPPPDGTTVQHPLAWSAYPRTFGQELVLPPSLDYYQTDYPPSASMAARARATHESSRAWTPAPSRLPTEQQQQMYARMQQHQHELLVAQAFASGRGRPSQPQLNVPGSQRNDLQPADPLLPAHLQPPPRDGSSTPTGQDSSTSLPQSQSQSQSMPSSSTSASAPLIQRSSSANLGHRVHLLSCAHCALGLTDRGMRAVLLLKPHISLYSTDACPVNVGPLFIPDGGGEAPRDGPERTCDCLTQGLGCLGCGSLLGYYIAIACSRCTNSVSKNQRSANGHRFVFHQNEVVSSERVYTPSEPGVISSLFPTANHAPHYPHANQLSASSTNTTASTLDPAAHKRSASGSSEADPSASGSRPSSAQSVVPQGRALQAGDVVFWRDLVKGGERVAPWFGPREPTGKKRRRADEEPFAFVASSEGGRSVGR